MCMGKKCMAICLMLFLFYLVLFKSCMLCQCFLSIFPSLYQKHSHSSHFLFIYNTKWVMSCTWVLWTFQSIQFTSHCSISTVSTKSCPNLNPLLFYIIVLLIASYNGPEFFNTMLFPRPAHTSIHSHIRTSHCIYWVKCILVPLDN